MSEVLINNHVLIPYSPNWEDGIPVRYALRELTEVVDSVPGSEDRAVYRPRARRDLAYRISGMDAQESFQMIETLRVAKKTTLVCVPMWGRGDGISLFNGNEITLQTPRKAWAVNDSVFIYSHATGDYEVLTVNAINGDILELDAAPNALEDAEAFPVLFGRLENVPFAANSGDQRDFEIKFAENPAAASVAAVWIPFLEGVHFEFFIDGSGSMNNEIAAITSAAEQLKVFIRDNVYSGNQSLADQYVRIQEMSLERWLEWMSQKNPSELSKRYVVLTFINESAFSYHDSPRVTASEPTISFSADYAAFSTEFARRDLSICKLYSIVPTDSQWEDENLAFEAHVVDAVEGNGNYSSLGERLRNKNVFYDVAIDSGQPASFFFNDIMQLVGYFV